MRAANIKRPFGLSVRAWRNRLGISQEVLAERAGLHRTYICDVERGTRNVSLQSIEKLARALGISLPALLSYVHNPLTDELVPVPLMEHGILEILLVEDLPDDVELTLRALKRANISNRIHVARDGVAALNFLLGTAKHPKSRRHDLPQLILLDLGLPKIDGLEVLRRIKTEERTSQVPVVVLTASTSGRDLAACKRLGADAFIAKPVDFKNLSDVTPKLRLQWALLKPAPLLRM